MNTTERRIAIQCISDLLQAGYAISVDDGEAVVLRGSTDAARILAVMGTTGEDRLFATHPDAVRGWVQFIYGNEPGVVIADYTINLESVLARTNALASEIYERG